ncbi:hypothetical protein [Algoriphagus boritolerans]|uniref:Uncharacterized protein n=1 Tax=Algoriphagus boritolerans DSM 17298 = JCM 18970 TaxID=1120964 RepID=A0A1H5WJY7_9BACT|nr:hypothetical protein [Algoriphagus boritolerans]SEF99600.1 hypothetical protein SAMN03080598_02099 [Algoriphagus boritolerans DSM 17298 = JCM 18970]
MTAATIKKNLDKAKDGIIKDSYTIQRTISFEDLINELLDKISERTNRFAEMTLSINSIVESLQNITWIVDQPNEQILKEINAILDISRGVHISLEKRKADLEKTGIFKICPESTQDLFDTIDSLGETIDDVEAIYFRLPNNAEFKSLCEKFSTLK